MKFKALRTVVLGCSFVEPLQVSHPLTPRARPTFACSRTAFVLMLMLHVYVTLTQQTKYCH
jgi:hypothetical protein